MFGGTIAFSRFAMSSAPGQSMLLTARSPITCHRAGLPCISDVIASTASCRRVLNDGPTVLTTSYLPTPRL